MRNPPVGPKPSGTRWPSIALIAALAGGCGDPASPGPAPVEIASLTVSPLRAIIATGETIAAQAAGRTAQGAAAPVTVTWQTSDQTVATVTASGAISGTGNGTATITARSGTISASLEIEVAPPGLERIVDSVRRAHGLPAMGGAIVTLAGTEALAVAGTRRASGGPAVTVNDKWHIGSNLKAITSALAGIAVDQGKLSWSTTVAEALPHLQGAIRPEYRDVTLDDLLSHRAGIRNDPPASAFAGVTALEQRTSLVGWTLAASPVGAVGNFSYSNLGYLVAAAMVEQAWDEPYEDLLTSRLLQPLGVNGLGWGPQAAAGLTDQPVAHSYSAGGWVPCEGCDNPPGLSAAGRAHLPLGDWAKLIREFLAAYAGTSTVLSPATGRELFRARVGVPGTDGYALGWVLVTRSWAGGPAATHDGSNTVNHSVAWLGLANGIAFIAVTNAADLNTGRTGLALDGLVGRMLGYHETGR